MNVFRGAPLVSALEALLDQRTKPAAVSTPVVAEQPAPMSRLHPSQYDISGMEERIDDAFSGLMWVVAMSQICSGCTSG